MAQPVAMAAVEVVAPIAGVHLVHADLVKAVGGGLDCVEQSGRLAGGEGNDQVRPGPDMVENTLGSYGIGDLHGFDHPN